MSITNIIGKQTGSTDLFGGSAVVEHMWHLIEKKTCAMENHTTAESP